MHSDSLNHILIVGAGAFGTALACSIQNDKNAISFLARDYKRYSTHQLGTPIPIHRFHLFDDFDGNLAQFDLVIFAIPTQSLRSVLILLKNRFESYKQQADTQNTSTLSFISTSKGIEQDSIKLPHQIFADVWGNEMSVAALSGPSFAKEMISKLPTCLALASTDDALLKKAIVLMHAPHFRLYDSHDIIGVEIGGALKNVIALLAGAIDGLELGHNAKSALMTLGLSDIAHIGARLGAHPITFMGLSGLGDLILTCTGMFSRNRQFGYRLSKGEPKEQIIHEMGGVIEGIATAQSAYQIMSKFGVSSTLLTMAYQVLYEDLQISKAIETIITRKQASEFRWLRELDRELLTI